MKFTIMNVQIIPFNVLFIIVIIIIIIIIITIVTVIVIIIVIIIFNFPARRTAVAKLNNILCHHGKQT